MYVTVKTFIAFAIFLYVSTQEIGKHCTLIDGTIGYCENVSKCKSAMKDIRHRIVPLHCGFTVKTPIVCCADKNETSLKTISSNNRISQKKCLDYLALNTSYDSDPMPFIIGGGGVDSKPKEFPHMAILGYRNNNDTIENRCGGSLISDQFVLTAAHCLESREFGPVEMVRLGDLDTASEKDEAEPQDFKVIGRYSHPKYNFHSFYNDLALIKLNQSVRFTTYVKPACLQFEEKFEQNMLTATGWGALYFGGDMHNFLQKLDIRNLPTQNCLPTYKPQPRLEMGINEELQICGGNLERSVDTCQGDSGGPLQFRIQFDPPVHRIVGVTSFGINCNLVPGIYTKVSKYISWIESIVWPN